MTIPHIAAWKIATWMGGSAVALAAAFAVQAQQGMNPTIAVALIMSGSSLLIAIVTGGVSIYMQRQTGKKVDGLFTQAHKSEQEANARADTAEGFRAGSESERDKNGK